MYIRKQIMGIRSCNYAKNISILQFLIITNPAILTPQGLGRGQEETEESHGTP
jgi:hypothetical protein